MNEIFRFCVNRWDTSVNPDDLVAQQLDKAKGNLEDALRQGEIAGYNLIYERSPLTLTDVIEIRVVPKEP